MRNIFFGYMLLRSVTVTQYTHCALQSLHYICNLSVGINFDICFFSPHMLYYIKLDCITCVNFVTS